MGSALLAIGIVPVVLAVLLAVYDVERDTRLERARRPAAAAPAEAPAAADAPLEVDAVVRSSWSSTEMSFVEVKAEVSKTVRRNSADV